ncbi:MAG: flagellar motor protein MotB [Allosphingosinicella sp.]|uniref:OmpA/MotB family protein n=1 Tax=Allosphingosinicella sp. TaxID=2823234 RepID=UPI003938A3F8
MARRLRLPLHRGKAEDSYFVSLNDLLIGMLFVFIILLMIFALSYQSAEAQLNNEVQRLQDELEGRESVRSSLLLRLEGELKAAGLQDVAAEPEQGILHLPESALFASGSADLGSRGQAALTRLATILARELPCYGVRDPDIVPRCPEGSESILEAVYVEGHTDNVPIATAEFRNNWELSSARAIRTYQFMTGVADSLKRVRNASGSATLFGVSAYAETRERSPNSNATEQGRRANRRIDLRFLLSPPTRRDFERAASGITRAVTE